MLLHCGSTGVVWQILYECVIPFHHTIRKVPRVGDLAFPYPPLPLFWCCVIEKVLSAKAIRVVMFISAKCIVPPLARTVRQQNFAANLLSWSESFGIVKLDSHIYKNSYKPVNVTRFVHSKLCLQPLYMTRLT